MIEETVSLLDIPNMTPNTSLTPSDSQKLHLLDIVKLSITAMGNFGSNATSPVNVYIFSSPDGDCWDTTPILSFSLESSPGDRCQKTEILFPDVRYIAAGAVNPNISGYIYNFKVLAYTVKP